MFLSQLIKPSRITIQDKPRVAKESLILGLLNDLSVEQKFSKEETQEAKNLLLEREKIMSTGVGDGVAIPHASVSFLSDPIGFFSLLKNPVNYNAIDKKPVNIIVLVLFPKNNIQLHIQILAAISRLLYPPENRKEILASKSKNSLWEKLKSINQ